MAHFLRFPSLGYHCPPLPIVKILKVIVLPCLVQVSSQGLFQVLLLCLSWKWKFYQCVFFFLTEVVLCVLMEENLEIWELFYEHTLPRIYSYISLFYTKVEKPLRTLVICVLASYFSKPSQSSKFDLLFSSIITCRMSRSLHGPS